MCQNVQCMQCPPPVMNANTYDIVYSGFPYVNLFEAAPYNINTVHQTFFLYIFGAAHPPLVFSLFPTHRNRNRLTSDQ